MGGGVGYARFKGIIGENPWCGANECMDSRNHQKRRLVLQETSWCGLLENHRHDITESKCDKHLHITDRVQTRNQRLLSGSISTWYKGLFEHHRVGSCSRCKRNRRTVAELLRPYILYSILTTERGCIAC